MQQIQTPEQLQKIRQFQIQELQTRLTKAGFDTGGSDGHVGNDTMQAVKDYQTGMGLEPADGYGGLKVLARVRQGG